MTLVLELILAALGLAATIFTWWVSNDAAKKAKNDSEKKEINDAVESGNIGWIHSIIDRMRK